MVDFSYRGFSGTWRKKEARVQGFGAGKQQGAGRDGASSCCWLHCSLHRGPMGGGGATRCISVLRPFQAAEIVWILL